MVLYRYLKRLYSFFEEKKKTKYLADLVSQGLKLGKNVEIASDYFFDPSHCFLISIGSNTIVAPNVKLVAHDASTKLLLGYTKIGKIDIGENCFLGESVIVLPGVTVGENSVIGSGSVVTRSIPDNSVAAGNPAKVIMSTDEYKKKILTMKGDKKVFSTDYYIENLSQEKRDEILDSVSNSIGFIV